jgi:soluble lytic murein transglycosylase-like protein
MIRFAQSSCDLLLACTLLAVCIFVRPEKHHPQPTPEQIWTECTRIAPETGLDPLLIYAVACAESSLDAHAGGDSHRGLMQLSRGAWKSVSTENFEAAWQWKKNLRAGARYLAHLRQKLAAAGRDEWPLIVASYHQGPLVVKKSSYRLEKLPQTVNSIYRHLYAGTTPPLPPPAPARAIRHESPGGNPCIPEQTQKEYNADATLPISNP